MTAHTVSHALLALILQHPLELNLHGSRGNRRDIVHQLLLVLGCERRQLRCDLVRRRAAIIAMIRLKGLEESRIISRPVEQKLGEASERSMDLRARHGGTVAERAAPWHRGPQCRWRREGGPRQMPRKLDAPERSGP